MRLFAKTILVLLIMALIGMAWLKGSQKGKRILSFYVPEIPEHHLPVLSILQKLRLKAVEAKVCAEKNQFNTDFCFLVDMSLPSHQKRFFVFNLHKDSIESGGLVAHGRCNQDWLEGRKYGNEPGCGCTSLGKYKIGSAYMGSFGLAFKLYGLDSTNSKAFDRFVVLHAHNCVPESEVGSDICQSNGCPMVSPGFLNKMEPLIKESKKPVLLWIFN